MGQMTFKYAKKYVSKQTKLSLLTLDFLNNNNSSSSNNNIIV